MGENLDRMTHCHLTCSFFIEGLISLLKYAERKVEIHGVKVCSGVPILSHLLFANECFSFCKIVHKETNCLNTILDKYGRASSQVINLDKSEVFFSTNTNQSLRQWTMISLGVSSTIGTCN